MCYELTDHECAAIRPDACAQAAWRPAGERSPCPQRYLLGSALRSALTGFAAKFWSVHHLLQSLRLLASSGRMGPDYERNGCHP
jgi:hypothetical protein